MRKWRLMTILLVVSLVLSISVAIATDDAASAKENEQPDGYPGSRSLGVSVSADGDALENVPVTIVDKKTGSQVFSGYTDSAGQIDVTLPQGSYNVVVQGQTKSVNLNNDQDVSFTLNSAERPNG